MAVQGAFHQLALAETYVDVDTNQIRVNDSIPICPSFGAIWYRSVDFGFPDVRESSQEYPERDGVLDETTYTGARNITIEGVVIADAFGDTPSLWDWDPDISWNSATYWISQLSGWASPARRFRFYFTDELDRSRFMDVRGDAFTAAVDKTSKDYREFQLNMTNPSGRVYSFTPGDPATDPVTVDGKHKQFIDLAGTGNAGRVYPEPGPYLRNYPDPTVGSEAILYKGTVPNGCVIEINTNGGTLNAPRVKFMAPNGTIAEIGLATMPVAVAANSVVTFDTVNRKVYSRSNAAGSVPVDLSQYLRAPLQWPLLRPGLNYNTPSGAPAAWRGSGVRGYNFVSFTGAAHSTATLAVSYFDADLL